MERFVQAIVIGGLTLLAGLWIVSVVGYRSRPAVLGGAFVLLGVAALAYGIRKPVRS